MTINFSTIIIIAAFVIGISIQYTLNKILRHLQEIEKTIKLSKFYHDE